MFAAIGCDKIENLDENDLYLYAKVENASDFRNVVGVKLVMRDKNSSDVELARGEWKDEGFTIVLPKISKNDYPNFITWKLLPTYIAETLTTITISDKNAKNGIVEFWGVDKDDNVVTRFFPHKIDEEGNTARVRIGYVDLDVSISGYVDAGVFANDYDECLNATFMWGWGNRTIYSIEHKEGWNAVSSFQSSQEGAIIDNLSTTSLNGLKWHGGESWKELDVD